MKRIHSSRRDKQQGFSSGVYAASSNEASTKANSASRQDRDDLELFGLGEGRRRPVSNFSSFAGGIGRRGKNTHCTICLQVFCEPYSLACGHSFCRECITQHLMHSAKCPTCETVTSTDPKKTKIIPNYAAAALLEDLAREEKLSTSINAQSETDEEGEAILRLIQNSDNIKLSSIRRISEALKQKTVEAELNDEQLRNVLLFEFLDKMIEKRELHLSQVQAQLEKLKADKQKIATILTGQLNQVSSQRIVPDSLCVQSADNTSLSAMGLEDELEGHSSSSYSIVEYNQMAKMDMDEGMSSSSSTAHTHIFTMPEQMSKYRRRLHKHIGSLESSYFSSKPVQLLDTESSLTSASVTPVSSQSQQALQLGSCTDNLEEFSQVLRGMSQYGDMKRLATLNYNVETASALSIVSSIEFDKDGEYFVIAGVTKKIKLYDYNAVINQNSNTHYPVEQLQCSSKISNVSWNPYNKSLLASSDYEGTVQLWDTAVGKATRTLKEHEKRCWTVQFNNVDPHLMASGSDDAKVKLWCVTSPQSICTIDAKVNVCCVYFSPKSKNHLVFGSADHCVHLYDIRNPSKALNIFRGHRKAVSYVKYCNESEVVSASTDSNLRVWDVNSGKCLQTMRGHQNEKNFVGLATDGNHVVCGSENNHLYLYYKSISEPLMSFDFSSKTVDNAVGSTTTGALDSADLNIAPSTPGSTTANTTESTAPAASTAANTNDFVSAVCWKKNTNVIVAANSQGTTHILQLQ